MKKVIAIGGSPGTGKSTLMKKIMFEIEDKWQHHYQSPLYVFYNDVKLVPYHKIGNVYILGYYPEGEVFGGTDKMSMAVQPEAIKFVDSLPSDSIILYEGDRLFTSSFIEHCSKYDLRIIVLKTSKEERQRRYKERGSNQNETWLAGRESKVNNIASNLTLMDKIEILNHDTKEDTEKITNHIMELINVSL